MMIGRDGVGWTWLQSKRAMMIGRDGVGWTWLQSKRAMMIGRDGVDTNNWRTLAKHKYRHYVTKCIDNT
jgi:hypothetical protein